MNDLPDNERIGERGGSPVNVPATASVDAMSPGARLAAERQAHGLTIEQVASQLNLAPRQIAALEADNYAALPGMVIARGFLRAYAKLLKVDPTPLLAVLVEKNSPASAVPMRHALSASFSETRLPSLTSSSMRSKGLPVVAGVAVVVAACAASYALGWWPESLSRRVGQFRAGSTTGGGVAVEATTPGTVADAPVAGVTETSATSIGAVVADDLALPLQSSVLPALPPVTAAPLGSAPVNVVPQPAAPSATVQPPTKGPAAAAADTTSAANPLVLNVHDDSWVEIKRADNTAVVGKIVKGGSVETFEVSEPVTVTIGNIAGVDASLRGTPLDLTSAATGNVARLRLK